MEHHFNASIDLPSKNNPAGFTMIEILIAMSLFVLGILSLMGMQISCINGNAAARVQTEATAIGAKLIERLRMLPENHPDLDSDGNPHELERDKSGSYTVRWVIADNPTDAGTKSVSVSVIPDNRLYGKPVTISTTLVRKGE